MVCAGLLRHCKVLKRLSWTMLKGVDCLVYRAAVVTWLRNDLCVRSPVCCPLKTRGPFTQVLKAAVQDGAMQLLLQDERYEHGEVWVPESKVLKCNEINRQKQKELQDQNNDCERKPVKHERPGNTDSPGDPEPAKQQKNITLSKIRYHRVTSSSSSQATDSDKSDGNSSLTGEDCQGLNCEALTEIEGVIFDMDGTMTLPVLDFKGIKRSLGLAPTADILPTVQKYSPKDRAKAMAIIEEYEEDGLRKLQLQPGLLDLLHYLAEREVKIAMMTRNSTKAANVFMERVESHLADNKSLYPCLQSNSVFSQVITRDFEPCKPHPAPVFHICGRWGVQPSQVAVVGDDKTDMISGLRAGTGVNILLKNERNAVQVDYSNFSVDSLTDICSLFDTPMAVVPKEPPDS